MEKNDKDILVVKRDILFPHGAFQGFVPAGEVDFESRIINNVEYMKRGLAENNSNFKQPIGYAMIVNPDTQNVFAYQRASKDSDYKETRLQGKWSWGAGGHIEKYDTRDNPIHASMIRELKEEIFIDGEISPQALGYINDDSNSVGKVHMAVLYAIMTDALNVSPIAPEMQGGKMTPISELENICSNHDVENWSKIAVTHLKKLVS